MMLQEDASDSARASGASSGEAAGKAPGKVGRLTVLLLGLLVLLLIVLRNDGWNWRASRPLLLGVIPIGLWWQMMVSLLASAMMALMVRFAWPAHLEHVKPELPSGSASAEGAAGTASESAGANRDA